MASVAVRTGPVSADDSARDVNPSRWLELTLARRTFVAINVPYDCRSLINFVDEAASHRIWEHTGHADLDDYIHHGLDIDPELVEWARLGLSVIGKEKPVSLGVAIDAGKKVAETMAKAPELMTATEAGKKGGRGKRGTKLVTLSKGGNDRLAARLKRDHPDIAARVEVLTQVLTGRIAPQPLRRLVPWSPSLCPETAPATQAGDRPQPAPAARQRPRGAAGIGE